MKRVVVIGAGPAGMMAAGRAAENGVQVTLIERNARPGRKLVITGKGRCNITNNCDRRTLLDNVAVNQKFLYSAFSAFTPQDTMEFFENAGVPLKTERGGRVFPVSDKAMDINDAMVAYCKANKVNIVTGMVTAINVENGEVVSVKTDRGIYPCDACVLAAGGASYPVTGSDGNGYALARMTGHTVTPISPSLVPINAVGRECSDMTGLSLRNIAITVFDEKGKKVYEDFGEMLFTHFGVSGPVILSASSHMKKGEGHVLSIDLKPALTPEQLDARILRDFSENPNRNFANSLGKLLPAKLISIIISRSGISPELKVNSVTREQRKRFCSLLKDFRIELAGFRPIDEAIITSGGVSVSEIDPKTMRSKLVTGLYFAGEIIDVDAHTGGFNLQIALSTGHCAGLAAAQ